MQFKKIFISWISHVIIIEIFNFFIFQTASRISIVVTPLTIFAQNREYIIELE